MIPYLVSIPDNTDRKLLSRSGYELPELVGAVNKHLGMTGIEATGKLMHFTADLVASGGKDIWCRLCYEHAFENIGIASPRIFTYLKRRCQELDGSYERLETESFYRSYEIQKKFAEMALVIQIQPRKPKLKLPTADPKTHGSREWLKSQLRAGDSAAVKKVWQSNYDQPELLHAANEMLYAASEGALSRALFWLKWMIDEDALIRKDLKGNAGLTTLERSPGMSKRAGVAVGQFIASVLAEAYKDLAGKGFIRMHEEFQGLLDIFRSSDQRLTAKRRQDCLVLMLQIITEVPKLKVPAAPELIKDKVSMERAVNQASVFFNEVLDLPPVNKQLPKNISKKKEPTKKKTDKGVDRDSLYDDVMNAYFDRM
jgi:hypothetical protein